MSHQVQVEYNACEIEPRWDNAISDCRMRDVYPLVRFHESREYAERDLGDPIMDFRLTYQGPLLSERDAPNRRDHKHIVRTAFHSQLKELWHTHPALKFRTEIYSRSEDSSTGKRVEQTRLDVLASNYVKHKVRWAPLINSEVFGTACSLNVLFLRPEAKGGVIKTGDLDNRVKLLFDALTMPQQENELPDNFDPKQQPDPFFCLLANDSLITHFTVTGDRLLIAGCDPTLANLVIEVKTMLADPHKGYLEFV
jgi:hypothetical protein